MDLCRLIEKIEEFRGLEGRGGFYVLKGIIMVCLEVRKIVCSIRVGYCGYGIFFSSFSLLF